MAINLPFFNRQAAALILAKNLSEFKNKPDTYILALVRGGIITGRILADELNLPLYPMVVRKIGHPLQREFGLGAISGRGAMYLDQMTLSDHGLTEKHLEAIVEEEKRELKRRRGLYYKGPVPQFKDKTIILTDDGAATGVSILATIEDLKKENTREIIVALPVCAPDTAAKFKEKASRVIILATPSPFHAVAEWYKKFPQVEDKEVLELLQTTANDRRLKADN